MKWELECKQEQKTIRFRERSAVPHNKKVTYGRIVASLRPHKVEKHRVRLTIGGNLLDYDGDASTPTTDLTTTKVFINSVISTNKARLATTDIENFYLNNDLPESEWMKLPLEIIPTEIIQQYNLDKLSDNGWVYIEILKAMYGLKQSGKIAYDELVKHSKPFGYSPTKHTPGYWRHNIKPISFVLYANDFAIKYTNNNDLNHLLQVLQTKYTITTYLTGSLYCGITLKWNYNKSM